MNTTNQPPIIRCSRVNHLCIQCTHCQRILLITDSSVPGFYTHTVLWVNSELIKSSVLYGDAARVVYYFV